MKKNRHELRTKRTQIRPQLNRLEKENAAVQKQLRRLELSRWVTTEPTQPKREQLEAQYAENLVEINRLYREAQFQKRSAFDKRLDFFVSVTLPVTAFTIVFMLVLIM